MSNNLIHMFFLIYWLGCLHICSGSPRPQFNNDKGVPRDEKTIFNESVEGGMHMDIDDGIDEGNVSGNVGF